jgi:hypothetical protein
LVFLRFFVYIFFFAVLSFSTEEIPPTKAVVPASLSPLTKFYSPSSSNPLVIPPSCPEQFERQVVWNSTTSGKVAKGQCPNSGACEYFVVYVTTGFAFN